MQLGFTGEKTVTMTTSSSQSDNQPDPSPPKPNLLSPKPDPSASKPDSSHPQPDDSPPQSETPPKEADTTTDSPPTSINVKESLSMLMVAHMATVPNPHLHAHLPLDVSPLPLVNNPEHPGAPFQIGDRVRSRYDVLRSQQNEGTRYSKDFFLGVVKQVFKIDIGRRNRFQWKFVVEFDAGFEREAEYTNRTTGVNNLRSSNEPFPPTPPPSPAPTPDPNSVPAASNTTETEVSRANLNTMSTNCCKLTSGSRSDVGSNSNRTNSFR